MEKNSPSQPLLAIQKPHVSTDKVLSCTQSRAPSFPLHPFSLHLSQTLPQLVKSTHSHDVATKQNECRDSRPRTIPPLRGLRTQFCVNYSQLSLVRRCFLLSSHSTQHTPHCTRISSSTSQTILLCKSRKTRKGFNGEASDAVRSLRAAGSGRRHPSHEDPIHCGRKGVLRHLPFRFRVLSHYLHSW